MFFLAVFVLATIMTEPPKVVSVYSNLDACLVQADKANFPNPLGPPDDVVRWVCLELRSTT